MVKEYCQGHSMWAYSPREVNKRVTVLHLTWRIQFCRHLCKTYLGKRYKFILCAIWGLELFTRFNLQHVFFLFEGFAPYNIWQELRKGNRIALWSSSFIILNHIARLTSIPTNIIQEFKLCTNTGSPTPILVTQL